ncbi:MAG: RagB/SusD family nutrient uptake outer membrane protein, partial [Bacteroidales bacterium]
MRKTYISAVLSGMLLFTACSDDLNTRPSTSLPTDEAIETNADLQLALNGVYQRVSRVRSLHAADFGLYADAKGGDTKVTYNSNQFSDVTNFQLNKQHSIPKDFYQELSRVIAFCNQALEAGEKLPASEKAKPEYKYIKGQLIAARALFHFDMARLFAQLPTIDGVDVNAAQSGIVINDQVFNVFHQFKRSTISETYAFIINGLNESLTMLSKEKQPGGINYYAAEALLARAYLYNGNWSEALKAA